MPKTFRKKNHCLNCQTEIGDANYCHNCGQINSHKQLPLKTFLQDIVGDYFTFDSRFFKSFGPLISKPGHLTNEYNSGRRSAYIFPLRLYIFTSIVFFFIITIQSKFGQSIEDIKKESIPITTDSISQVIEGLDYDIDQAARRDIAYEMKNNFTIKARLSSPDYVTRDSLSYILNSVDSSLSETANLKLARQLDLHFRFSKKKKNRKNALDSLNSFLHVKSSLTEEKQLAYSQHLDSIFRIRIRNLNKTGNIQFSGGTDSLDSGIIKDFFDFVELKGQYLSNQGDKGLGLLLTELLNGIPQVMFLILPIFALILKLLYIRRKILYINHLIFTLHLHTIIFIYLMVAILVNHWISTVAVIIAIWIHMFVAFRNVYQQSKLMTFLKLNTLILVYNIPLLGGFIIITVMALINV